jgi:phospholipase/lecithinase/hemolysin
MYPGGYRGVYVDPTNQTAATQIINTSVQNVSNAVQSLYAKGARAFLYMKQGGTNASDITALGFYRAGLYDAYTRSYNAKFSAAMNAISRSYADVRICEMDFYSLYDAVSQHPMTYGFTDSLSPGLSEANRAFDGPGASHLFWDSSHATSKFHSLMADWNLDSLRTNVFEEMVLSITKETAKIEMRHLLIGRDYTLQKTSDLNSWNHVQTFTASAGTNQVSQTLEAGTGSVFYRLQWQP